MMPWKPTKAEQARLDYAECLEREIDATLSAWGRPVCANVGEQFKALESIGTLQSATVATGLAALLSILSGQPMAAVLDELQ